MLIIRDKVSLKVLNEKNKTIFLMMGSRKEIFCDVKNLILKLIKIL